MITRTRSAAETRRLGADLALRLRPSGTALLFGDLGSGKTVLTQGIAEGLGLDPAVVQSPTFTLIHEYDGGPVRLVHVDLYRLAPEDVEDIGLNEVLAGDGVKVIEWAERLPWPLPGFEVRLCHGGSPGEREVIVGARTDRIPVPGSC